VVASGAVERYKKELQQEIPRWTCFRFSDLHHSSAAAELGLMPIRWPDTGVRQFLGAMRTSLSEDLEGAIHCAFCASLMRGKHVRARAAGARGAGARGAGRKR